MVSLFRTKLRVEKNFSNIAHLALVYEDNVRSSGRSIELSFRYDLPFAQTAATARLSNETLMTTESARGSFSFGSGNNYVHTDNRPATGRAGLVIIPFLDLNNNNSREPDEPIASGLDVRLNGGRLINEPKDSLIRVIELEPYISYMLEVEDTGFENIAWQLKDKTFNILTDPSQFKKVNIPVKVMGEANGTVQIKKGRTIQPQGRIIINFINESGKRVNSVLSETDGYFNFLGLPPGNYIARPDSAQLKRLKLLSEPASFKFEITPSTYGDIIDNIEFTLISTEIIQEDTIPEQKLRDSNDESDTEKKNLKNGETDSPSKGFKSEVPENIRDIKKLSDASGGPSLKQNILPKKVYLDSIPYTIIRGKYNIESSKWFVQAGAYLKLNPANTMYDNLISTTDFEGAIIKQGKYFKVRITGSDSENQARAISATLSEAGIINFIGYITY
jgi:hypothetical protein